jgi:GAF domain-containing protein
MLVQVAEKLDAFRIRRRDASRPAEAAEDHLKSVLEELLAVVEDALGGSLLTSILLLDGERQTLRHAAAPRLPRDYCAAIDGLRIGPGVGSCGTAAYFGHAIYVADVAHDPLWRDFAHLAAAHGLAACWSTPIEGSAGGVLGTFAIYHRERRSPTTEEIKAIALITEVVRWEIERRLSSENT